jgi:hypothetical protein
MKFPLILARNVPLKPVHLFSHEKTAAFIQQTGEKIVSTINLKFYKVKRAVAKCITVVRVIKAAIKAGHMAAVREQLLRP